MANLSVDSPNWPGTYDLSSMNLKPIIACTSLAACLWGAGDFPFPAPASASGLFCSNPEYISPEKRLKPLMDLIAKGEGDYNSVNRGYAGDTPGGIQSIGPGWTFENYTVQQVIDLQRTKLYAVGRYQFIPSTLRWAVKHSSVSELDMFTPEVQDRLMATLVIYKRPAIGAYLRGDHDLLGWALNEMAKEWASVEYRNGRSFYSRGGNRAKISRAEVSAVLQDIKSAWQAKASAS